MKRVKVDHFCDFCMHEGQQECEAPDTYTTGIALGEKAPTLSTIDVCEAHGQQLETLAYVIRTMGAPLDASTERKLWPATSTTMACTLCGTSLLIASYPEHLVQVHKAKRITQPKKCPDCDYKNPTSSNMRAHRHKKHGYTVYEDMLKTVKSK